MDIIFYVIMYLKINIDGAGEKKSHPFVGGLWCVDYLKILFNLRLSIVESLMPSALLRQVLKVS